MSNGAGAAEIRHQYRDASQAPTRKLSVNLINTYKSINEVIPVPVAGVDARAAEINRSLGHALIFLLLLLPVVLCRCITTRRSVLGRKMPRGTTTDTTMRITTTSSGRARCGSTDMR